MLKDNTARPFGCLLDVNYGRQQSLMSSLATMTGGRGSFFIGFGFWFGVGLNVNRWCEWSRFEIMFHENEEDDCVPNIN